MIILLSPSKTLDFENPTKIRSGFDPLFIKQSAQLINKLKKVPISNIMEIMGISRKLAELNHERYNNWSYPYQNEKAKPAMAAFMGDVYEGLRAWEFNSSHVEFADQHVRILSGLYGLLKPTDLILPYRLEMGIELQGTNYNNLYEFWGDRITNKVKQDLKSIESNIIVNLASVEYAKAVKFNKINARVITPFFMEMRNGKYKFITLNGKKARGTMTRYIIDKQIANPEEIKLFNYDGYSYDEMNSKNDKWVFIR